MSALHRHTDMEPGAASRFGLAYERLEAEDRARREWLDRAARIPDPDETRVVQSCPTCGALFGGDMRHTVCEACRAKGLISTPCRKCGGPLKRLDVQGSKRNPERMGCCAACRAKMPPAMTPQESLVLARAAKQRGRPKVAKTPEWKRQRDIARAKRLLRQRGYRTEEAA